ncbi:hypothetical protein RUM44_011381 [Polyplax serrata]|uniref:ABC transporter domain-containing protein n=1 Tax=Polyplax serrata TaxID=468196 RepID=A0ABR1APW3_POLSC
MVHNLFVILWKDLLIRRNHFLATACEILIPIGLIILANVTLPKSIYEINNDLLFFRELNASTCSITHSHYESIRFEPSTPFTDDLMSKAACYAGYKQKSVKSGSLDSNNTFTIGIKFHLSESDLTTPQNLNYSIYPTHEVWIYLNKLWRTSEASVPRYTLPLLQNVIEIQRAIDVSYINLKNIAAPKMQMQNTDLYDRNPRVFPVAIYLCFFLGLSLMVPPVISRVIQEKFTGAKEMMLMMGVKKWQLWIAKFIDSFFFQFITISGMVLFVYIPLKQDSNVLKVSPFIFLSVVLYGLISVILFLFFLSNFFKKQKKVKINEKLSGSDDHLTLLQVLLFMTSNIVLYSILTWYFEQVKPGEYGVPKPYGFCFKKSYWISQNVETFSNTDEVIKPPPSPGFEPIPPTLKTGICIEGVTKKFSSLGKGSVIAVDNVSIDFYRGEISALLGHNGAGKTTMFSMISGLIHPSSGRVLINNYDLAVNINEARSSLGLCPQKDMLFTDLTVAQILRFYGVIKGLALKQAQYEANELIKSLKLMDVVSTQTGNLSGGQKRKVSLAIALIGGSDVLILDEPTSGMDPEIRREIWELLLGLRGSRTILLTTHFMEEADALCDRIAVMDCGKIKCYGSPMFLKTKYGKGYVLSIVVPDVGHYKDVTETITDYIPTARFKCQNIRTVSYELPESEITKFPSLFSALDEKQAKNEIVSYGVSVATLEDVFLKLKSKSETTDDFDVTDSAHYIKFLNGGNATTPKVSDSIFYLYQFWALIIKKWIFFQRQFKLFLVYSILAGLLVAISTLMSNNNQGSGTKSIDLRSRTQITFSPDLYAPLTILYSTSENSTAAYDLTKYLMSLRCGVRKVPDVEEEIHKIYERDFYEYARKTNLGIKFGTQEITVYQNDRAVHMVPIALNLMHNYVLETHHTNSSIVTSLNITYASRKRTFKAKPVSKCTLGNIPDFSGFQTLFYFLAPLKEEMLGAKEMQLMITPTALYWLSYLAFDIVSFTVYMIFICLFFGFVEGGKYLVEHAGEIFGSLLFWGIGMILLAYSISSVLKDEAGAFTVSIIIYVIFTFIFNNPISTLGLPEFVHYLHPTSIVKNGYSNLCVGESGGDYILYLFIYNVVLLVFLVIKDSKILSQAIHTGINKLFTVNYEQQSNEDELVASEKALVESTIAKGQTSGFALVVHDLKKWYLRAFKFQPSVRGISFTVKEGECFGLLGVNGAGKTSTFKMLTGTIPYSGGETFMYSQSLTFFNRQKYLFQIGYCPQAGGIIPTFKGSELLKFFARLRGVSSSHLNIEVSNWLQKLDLYDFASQNCGTYSGGNQRKLSTAISLIGDSRLIFLDEPTSGVDPASRRLMWNVIDEVQKQGRSVVLTSHCMDECDALCSRLAIMVKGRFRCIGEITTLKKKFGQGYSVYLKVSCGAPAGSIQMLKESVMSTFECTLIDEHLTILQYHVAKQSASWASLFSKLKELKDRFEVLESYTASETTLEQIFIFMARNQ